MKNCVLLCFTELLNETVLFTKKLILYLLQLESLEVFIRHEATTEYDQNIKHYTPKCKFSYSILEEPLSVSAKFDSVEW